MLGRKIVMGTSGRSSSHHVLAEFLCAGVGIVVGAIPVDRTIFRHHFVLPLPGHGHRAHVTEAAQAMIVVRAPRQLEHLERAAQVHVQAALFRLAIQGGGAVNDRIRRVNEAVVVVPAQPELRRSDIAAEDANPGLEMLVEARKIHVQLQPVPEPNARLPPRLCARTSTFKRSAMCIQQIGGHVRANVACRTGQEYRHVAPLVPVFDCIRRRGGSSVPWIGCADGRALPADALRSDG